MQVENKRYVDRRFQCKSGTYVSFFICCTGGSVLVYHVDSHAIDVGTTYCSSTITSSSKYTTGVMQC